MVCKRSTNLEANRGRAITRSRAQQPGVQWSHNLVFSQAWTQKLMKGKDRLCYGGVRGYGGLFRKRRCVQHAGRRYTDVVGSAG